MRRTGLEVRSTKFLSPFSTSDIGNFPEVPSQMAVTVVSDNLEIRIPDDFQGFDPDGTVRIYTRNLPHWRQAGASYFVTFRLADSIPAMIWLEMKQKARFWRDRIERETQRNHGALPRLLASEWEQFQRRHLAKMESILDSGMGSCVLANAENRDTVDAALRHFDGQRYTLHGFVVMPNHVHLSMRPHPGWELEKILQSWKGLTSREINRHQKRRGTLWQSESYDRIIRDSNHFARVIRYMVLNPVKAKLEASKFTLMMACASLRPAGCEQSRIHGRPTSDSIDHEEV